jgi:negative regulator of flagellin synthesis FlgM
VANKNRRYAMAIEISKATSSSLPLQESKARTEAAHGAEPNRPAETRGAADSVSLTNTADRLQRLGAELSRLPVVDTQRVERVQQAMNDGTYAFDAARVAAKLVHFERQINGGS